MKIHDLRDKDDDWDFPPEDVEIRGDYQWVKPYYMKHRFRVSNVAPLTPFIAILRLKFNDRDDHSHHKDIARGRYYIEQAEDGSATKVTDPEMEIDDNVIVQYTKHVHEYPVANTRIRIVYEDEKYVVVNKPSSIPTVQAFPYYKNCLPGTLHYQNPRLRWLQPVHRLDLPTSGILILAKDATSGTAFKEKMAENSLSPTALVHKHYVARVKCEFPLGDITVKKRLWGSKPDKRKEGECRVRYLEDGEEPPAHLVDWVKTATTTFRRISYHAASGTSTVHAWIVTGRQHQIRVHLLSLGFPIVNDPDYGWSQSRKRKKRGVQESDMSVCDECGVTYVTSPEAVRSHMLYLHSLEYIMQDERGRGPPPYCNCTSGCGKNVNGSYYFHTASPDWLDDSVYAQKYYSNRYYEPYWPDGPYCRADVTLQSALGSSGGMDCDTPLSPMSPESPARQALSVACIPSPYSTTPHSQYPSFPPPYSAPSPLVQQPQPLPYPPAPVGAAPIPLPMPMSTPVPASATEPTQQTAYPTSTSSSTTPQLSERSTFPPTAWAPQQSVVPTTSLHPQHLPPQSPAFQQQLPAPPVYPLTPPLPAPAYPPTPSQFQSQSTAPNSPSSLWIPRRPPPISDCMQFYVGSDVVGLFQERQLELGGNTDIDPLDSLFACFAPIMPDVPLESSIKLFKRALVDHLSSNAAFYNTQVQSISSDRGALKSICSALSGSEIDLPPDHLWYRSAHILLEAISRQFSVRILLLEVRGAGGPLLLDRLTLFEPLRIQTGAPEFVLLKSETWYLPVAPADAW